MLTASVVVEEVVNDDDIVIDADVARMFNGDRAVSACNGCTRTLLASSICDGVDSVAM